MLVHNPDQLIIAIRVNLPRIVRSRARVVTKTLAPTKCQPKVLCLNWYFRGNLVGQIVLTKMKRGYEVDSASINHLIKSFYRRELYHVKV